MQRRRGTFRTKELSYRRLWAAALRIAGYPVHFSGVPCALSRDTATVVGALTKHVRKLPQQLRRSLTWDRGKEMADHKSFTVATNVQVYFCDPHSPWQRGSNENTNGLLRQYFPRGTDLSRFSQDYLNRIARRLNQRPRKTLGFETPADRLQAVLH
jgi:IS30 family transposase